MKYFYIAAIYKKGEKFYAALMTVAETTNLCYALSDCHAANLFHTKKRADEVVRSWNKGFQENGTYLY